jgi:hypothetical protein
MPSATLIPRLRVPIAAAVAAALTLPAPAELHAQRRGARADLDGDAIVEKMLDQDPMTFGGAEAELIMVLVNGRGQQRRRTILMRSRRDGETRRSFLRFSAPNDIAGTSFLGIDDDGERVQYIYLPAVAKTRRISGTSRNGRFVGSDFTYADMDNRDIEDATKRRVDNETIGSEECYVVEVVPTDKDSQYARILVAVAKSSWLPLRIRFFDAQGDEVKRMTVKEVKKAEGKWIIGESKMVDLKRDHTTVMKLVTVKLRDDVPLDQFTVRALDRE